MSEAEQLILAAVEGGIKSPEALRSLKNDFAAKFKKPLFSNIELLNAYRDLIKKKKLELAPEFWNLLRRRGVRSKSGIVSVTVLTKKYPCPGACIYCPSEPLMPKSYLSNEPAVMRAILSDFDPYKQTINRIRGLENSGHHTDKVEIIVSGGTFSYYPELYKRKFIKGVFDGLNESKSISGNLASAQKINETAAHRCIGLSLETRPDYINEEEVKAFRLLGATKVELGVQSLDDRVLKLNKRGHTAGKTREAMRLLKDAAFKVTCHIMPNLYGSTPTTDLRVFRSLFTDGNYRPDWLKIYPCVVVPWTRLEQIYGAGKYRPYSDKQLIELLIKMKMLVPEYVRITRLYRDIPAPTILAGSKMSNIRQKIQEVMNERGLRCRCIRCREIQGEKIDSGDLELKVLEYAASGGREFFISYNRKKTDKLCSLLRLRFSSYSLAGKKHFLPELEGAALIREVHTYGEQLKIGSNNAAAQHIGLGKSMIRVAEEISRKNGFGKIAVISGIGVREYYRKLGYRLEGTYMVKTL